MAEAIISPGVFTRENDISFIQPAPAAVGTAFVGPTVKGPVNIPTVITSYSQYRNVYGETFTHTSASVSKTQEFLTSMAVKSFFDQGGNTALVVRVASGSFSSAVDSGIVALSSSFGAPFVLETLSQGVIMNSTGSEAADGTLASGSTDNLRWEVTGVNNTTGTFNLLVRRGDDTTKNKIILETFTNLSLDPESDNYVALRIGDRKLVTGSDGSETFIKEEGLYANRSSFLRVKEVLLTTPTYVAANSGSLPAASSGSFKDATGVTAKATAKFYNTFDNNDIQGVDTGSYDTAAAVLANKDEYQFNVLVTPGLVSARHSSTVSKFVTLVEERSDAIYVTDLVDYGALLSTVTAEAANINSSFTATYWPFVQLRSATGKNQFVPASTVLPGVFAFNDNLTAPWFAPAGLIRGGIPGVIQAERKLTKSNRDSLYGANVNPIATFPGTGVSILGQKTLQKKASALDRVNVRRLVLELKKFFSEQARNLLFEQNTIATRNRFLAAVNPYLESVVQRQGLFAFRVVMDDTNNTADVIDRNQLVGQVFIQPSRTAEFIVLDFTIEPTGATFGA